MLSLAAIRPFPEQGPGIRRLYVIFDLVIWALTVVLVVSLARIPGRHRRLAQRGIASRSGLVWRGGLAAVSYFAWPLLVLYLALRVLVWKVFVMYQPDLAYWLVELPELSKEQIAACLGYARGLSEFEVAV